MDSDLESTLISLISQLLLQVQSTISGSDCDSDWESKIMPLVIQIISVVRSMDLDDLTKPESKLMSLVSQAISLFKSTDLDSLPNPLRKLISFISQKVSIDLDQELSGLNFLSLVDETLKLKPYPELISLIYLILSVVISTNTELKELTFLFPQVEGYFHEGKFHVTHDGSWDMESMLISIISELLDLPRVRAPKWEPEIKSLIIRIIGLFKLRDLDAQPKPESKLMSLALNMSVTRGCYCCDEDIMDVFYLCLACDFALNIACVEKPRVLSIPPSKWHEHSLTLFPRKTSITCDICALDHSNCPIYICSPCDFVAHLKCINLPRVLRISRHLHRICYTPSFGGGDWSCGVCCKKMDNDYGGYSCVRDGCSYAAHSRCATQENIWDGIDLEGEPEEIEEQVAEPFVRICDGYIQHFLHEHHFLRLDENTCRNYDVNKLCQACITPIYFGNLYSCVQCEFVLHETCANLSRKIYHPIHPHLLTLAMRNVRYLTLLELKCTACCRRLITGFFYECDKGGHNFRLHVQCATISEPLVHRSHGHPLFLTSKPEEMRECSVCQRSKFQTFNCIDECDDFALCFACATLPQKLRYTHDKHILTLSYGEETSSKTYWCEACEGKINPKNGFYMCDEYCRTTLHIECLIGKDLYMMPGSWFPGYREQVRVLPNNHHMSRPICSKCGERCPQKINFRYFGKLLCSLKCLN